MFVQAFGSPVGQAREFFDGAIEGGDHIRTGSEFDRGLSWIKTNP